MWAPTLLRVDGDRVRAWTGRAIALPLARRLGPAASARVIQALGRLRRRADGRADELPGAPTGAVQLSRARFLRLSGGVGVLAGMALTGTMPAFADIEKQSARDWVAANPLPDTYDTFAKYPLTFRREIFAASAPEVRSRLWTAHLDQFRAARPSLTPEQHKVLDEARALVTRHEIWEPEQAGRSAVTARLRALRNAAIEAFSKPEAYAAIATLGPAPASLTQTARTGTADTCPCATTDAWCGDLHCYPGNCDYRPSGCGTAWVEPCDGTCS
ncbi:bacteriocin fulvocin C-related protein [Kribbella sindirgiensis]|uniref:Bacteriocin fulvocin C-related protein n=1 Tax=Kribbella sindirgiensis TaxID=1124744 RepID=A0A4R0I8V1_9ACTN|nr:bacteriocin fulvocin C-related protein [Kribbella sindirgiensis]TCC23202.1 hypothetical protein E0H50_33985 [Kribbella sindirgiensis]